MSCSTTTSECLPASDRNSSAVRSVSSSVMPATGSSSSSSFGSCISSMPISSHCFWPCDSSPAVRCALLVAGGSASSISPMRSRCAPSQPREQRARARRLSAFSASSRFSNTRVLLEHRRLLELAADAGVRDLGLAAAQSGRWSGRRTRVPASGRVLPVMHVHHRGLAGAVRADDAAQLADVDRRATGRSAP